ncbi:hypothetical protein B0H67DRAFT_679539 [Lasiosphaeris hirsuta]|uniref:Uncharacterized protein n=1 Tax=Lasiosphaeris hirsuta TaxID=260670 RepID=A0AA40BD31_9PEZI|nr:hypothetical protein B0H67DRAFT_679539 [Lasiosphaeris hirsuta]
MANKQCIFALCAGTCLLLPFVRADDLSDFSNNLATDIGPLLVLFGESMTKQYLSESTSFLDYFIFAMAPIGILTAIISTIRVCGHSSLRAFIGRSQEGDGAVEAELCTSTSRDVCELFNRGGITRVLGKPDILELIYFPDSDTQSLQLLRGYLKDPNNTDCLDKSWWQREDDSLFRRRTKDSDGKNPFLFAPNPNLSLNVGIVKPPDWVLYVIAATGFVLQAGVLALAGTGVWILGWNLNGGGSSSASRDYAPAMFITGTALMCGGMWSCAALIGQTTHEVRFRRTKKPRDDAAAAAEPAEAVESAEAPKLPKPPRLLWLQPGPQVIGDQSFDPFAYFEDTTDNPLQTWTSSRKDFDEKFETYTFLAVLAVLIGYLMQFIGLRGMKAWVSLVQLGITLVMSVLRGCLRMQRLGRNDNMLLTMPDMFEDAVLSPKSEEIQARLHVQLVAPEKLSIDGSERGLDYTALLSIRKQLAHLTGNLAFGEVSEHQKWRDTRVKVRAKAAELRDAICQAAEMLWKRRQWKYQSEDMPQRDTTLEIRAVADNQLAGIALRSPPDESKPGWEMDLAQLEAILGLWMWTLVSDERLVSRDSSHQETSRAEDIRCMRIVSAGGLGSSNRGPDKQGEMDLWLGSNAVTLLDSTLTLAEQSCHGIGTLWVPDGEDGWELMPPKPKHTMSQMQQRLCGWHPLHRRPRGQQENQSSVKLRVQITPAGGPLLDLCARELFTSLAMSLMGILNVESTTVVENAGLVQLENPTVATFARAFAERGLGSYSEALLCLVPAFRTRSPLPSSEDTLPALLQAAKAYRKASEWGKAQTMLRWACTQYAPSSDEAEGSPATAPSDLIGSLFTEALRATGELYRWSLAVQYSGDERKEFGRSGIKWMAKTYRSAVGPSIPEVAQILDCYETVARRLATAESSLPSAPQVQEVSRHLVQAIRDRNRTDALYYLCLVKTGDFVFGPLQPALPLAVRNDWSEVVDAVLEMRAGLNSQDEHRRTALFYCAESGLESYAKLLVDLGAFPDQPDDNQRTPLSVASQLAHWGVVKLLVKTEHVNIEATDEQQRTPLLWAAEKGHEAVVRLLLEKGADLESKDKQQCTPLLWAAENGHEAVVRLLLEKGADLESKNSDGQTSLSLATNNGHEAVVRQLRLTL